MEPLSAAMIAVAVAVATKVLEKPAEKTGEAAFNSVSQFLSALRKRSPETVVAIEQAESNPPDYEKAVLAVRDASQADFAVAESVQELILLSEQTPLPNLAEYLEQIGSAVAQSQRVPDTVVQNIEKAVNVAKEMTVDQRNSTFNL